METADGRSLVDNDSSVDDTDDEQPLKIVEELPSTPKKKKKILKTIDDMDDFDGSLIDKTISNFSEKCNNFTPEVAKKILLKLVKNEHVLAHAILKAEEEEAKEQKMAVKNSEESDDDTARSEPELPAIPKMTRLKAKQLNTKMPGPGPLTEVPPNEEVVALIHEELRSDDEDDEYQPCEDENQSDDEYTNTTFSDIDSQPSTPGSALFNQDNISPAKSGEFKVPRPIFKLSQEESETISKRTRSKLCLTTTPIETIESTFIPPDITLDMYDIEYEQEDDNEWKEFLNEFMMPLLNNPEEDDVEDPEYVASDTAPPDKEELRPVRVSKKELNQLISELIDESANFMTLDDIPMTSSSRKSLESTGTKRGSSRISSPVNNPKSPKFSKTSNDLSLQTPTKLKTSIVETTPVKSIRNINSSILRDTSTSYLQSSNQFETPKKVQSTPTMTSPHPQIETESPVVTSPSVNNQNFPQITGVYGSQLPSMQNQSQSPMILVTNAQNQLELVPASSILNQAFNNNGIVQLPQFQSVVTMVPTIDILQNRWNIMPMTNMPLNEEQTEISEIQIEEINTVDDESTIDGSTQKKERFKKNFEEFQDLEARTPTEHVFPAGSVGFTSQQLKIYEQQMRIHCQLLTQNFFQTFSHPKLWTQSDQFEKNLHELEDIVKSEISPVNSEHIKTCIETCESWKKELDDNNERNKKYAEFMYAEVDYDKQCLEKRRSFVGRFHPRLMEHLLNSKAILYPWLLPVKAFRSIDFKKYVVPNSELTLWAFEIGKFYAELHEKVNRPNRKHPRDPTVAEIAAELLHRLGKVSNEKLMTKSLTNLKVDKRMNPIKYVFKHKRYFNYQHNFEEIDLNKICAPVRLRRGLLPKSWDEYMFSIERLQRFPYQPHYEDEEDCVEIISEEAHKDIDETSIVNIPAKVLTVDNSFQVEIVYGEIPKINISLLQNNTQEQVQSEIVSCSRLLSPEVEEHPSILEVSYEDKQTNLPSILKKVSRSLDYSPSKQRKSVNFILPTPSEEKFNIPFILSQKFFIIIESFFANYCENLTFKRSKTNLLPKVFIWTRNFDIYSQFVTISFEMSKKKGVENGEIPTKTKRSVSSEEFTNKLKKKLQETRNSIIETGMNKCSIEKDCSFAYNYLELVRNALMENGDDDLFVEFMSVLRCFDPSKQSVPELYYKIESLFLPNYADLVDIFVTFMLPEHAAEVGKFFENFALNDMQNLIKKLTIVFNKQPNQIKKILTLLAELASERDVTIEVIKEKLFPLLKGNQLLIDWFMRLFDKPTPTDCPLSEYETFNLKKSVSDDSSEDSYEEIPATDLIECENFDEMKSCGVQYRNGKIYYYCGTLLPAKIAFLAIDAKLPEPAPNSSNEPRGLCVHEIRKHVTFTDKKLDEPNENARNTVGKKKIKKKDKEGGENSENIGRKVKKKKKSVICDPQTLHAHAVRLNPVHAQNGEKLSDLSHYFTGSPKKHRNKKNVTSPEKASPSSETATISDSSPTQPIITIQKNIRFEDVSDEPIKKKMKLSEETPPIPRVTTTIISAEKQSSSAVPTKKTRIDAPTASTSSSSIVKKEKLAQDRSSENWTREEDKIILEEIKVAYDDKEKAFEVLLSKLKRTKTEIQQRYEFLFDLVMMMN